MILNKKNKGSFLKSSYCSAQSNGPVKESISMGDFSSVHETSSFFNEFDETTIGLQHMAIDQYRIKPTLALGFTLNSFKEYTTIFEKEKVDLQAIQNEKESEKKSK